MRSVGDAQNSEFMEQVHSGKLNGISEHLGDVHISAKLILKCVSQKLGARMWKNSTGSGLESVAECTIFWHHAKWYNHY